MTAQPDASGSARRPLSRERVLRAAVALADEQGIDAVTMRNVGGELGVEAMSLYNHVANKEDLLDGMIEVVVGEIVEDVARRDLRTGWQPSLRQRILAAREVMLRHRWAPAVIETRHTMTPTLIAYYEDVLATLRGAGFSIELAHHAMHALGSRALGFTQELFDAADGDMGPDAAAVMAQQMRDQFPHISELVLAITHDESTTLQGCDDQQEFEFGLDLLLDGLERLRDEEAAAAAVG